MEEREPLCYEDYPWWIVGLSNLVSLGIYGLGAFIMFRAGWIAMVLYLAYVLGLEIKLLRTSCVRCCYYGRTCAFGKGRLAAVFFKKKESENLSQQSITWLSLVPDVLAWLAPVVAGVVVLIRDFDWLVLAAMALMLALSTAGTGLVRGRLACAHCRQREIGCPAEQLFDRTREPGPHEQAGSDR